MEEIVVKFNENDAKIFTKLKNVAKKLEKWSKPQTDRKVPSRDGKKVLQELDSGSDICGKNFLAAIFVRMKVLKMK